MQVYITKTYTTCTTAGKIYDFFLSDFLLDQPLVASILDYHYISFHFKTPFT